MADQEKSTRQPQNAFRESFLAAIDEPNAHAAARGFGELLHSLVYEADLVVRNPKDESLSGSDYGRWQFAGAVAELRQAMAALHEVTELHTGQIEDSRLAVAAHDALTALRPVAADLNTVPGS